MKLYLLSQNENSGYDTYDSCVVCAENEQDARNINPGSSDGEFGCDDWAFSPEKVQCEEIGEANANQKRGVIVASFNAG